MDNWTSLEHCESGFTLTCARLIFTSVWAFIVVVIAFTCIVKLYGMQDRVCYEMLPLFSAGL